MLSCVVNGLPPQHATVAPSSFAPINRTEVSFVMCKQNPSVMPFRGFDFLVSQGIHVYAWHGQS